MKYCKKRFTNTSRKSTIIIFLILFAAIGITLVFSSCSAKHAVVDPFGYFEVEFTGTDSMGKAIVNFNSHDFLVALVGEEPEDYEKWNQWYKQYELYEEAIEFEHSELEGLSNGDSFVITFTVDDILKNKVKADSKTFTVSGLREIETVDIFENATVSFNGLSGEAYIRVETNTGMDDIKFSCSENGNLANGDIATVEIVDPESLVELYAIIPKETSKTYEVSGLSKYIDSAEDLTMELVTDYAEKYEKQLSNDINDDDIFTHSNFKYYGTFILINKNKDYFFWNPHNELHVMVCYDQYYYGEFDCTVYIPLVFENVIVDSDGNLNISYEDGINAYSTGIEDYFNSDRDDFEIVTVHMAD